MITEGYNPNNTNPNTNPSPTYAIHREGDLNATENALNSSGLTLGKSIDLQTPEENLIFRIPNFGMPYGQLPEDFQRFFALEGEVLKFNIEGFIDYYFSLPKNIRADLQILIIFTTKINDQSVSLNLSLDTQSIHLVHGEFGAQAIDLNIPSGLIEYPFTNSMLGFFQQQMLPGLQNVTVILTKDKTDVRADLSYTLLPANP